MKCIICKNGETHPGEITLTLERDYTTLVLKNVPAEVCGNCGESYIDEKVTKQLLDTADEAVREGVEIDVRRFSTTSVEVD